jgi:C1A family cysteine protease
MSGRSKGSWGKVLGFKGYVLRRYSKAEQPLYKINTSKPMSSRQDAKAQRKPHIFPASPVKPETFQSN